MTNFPVVKASIGSLFSWEAFDRKRPLCVVTVITHRGLISLFGQLREHHPQMNPLCQSCEIAESSVCDGCDDASDPYLLCQPCSIRLQARSLRPAEWYRLSKRHGWRQHLLHDDFYDEDGTASQPEQDVVALELLPIPRLEDIAARPDELLDFSLTRWHLEPPLRAAWGRLDPSVAVQSIVSRWELLPESKWFLRSRLLEVAALAGATGASFTRRAWAECSDHAYLYWLALASSACLPPDEGLALATARLDAVPSRELRDVAMCLSHFRSPLVLDWLETHVTDPIMESWGYIAAASQLDWSRAERWLLGGRPLSLVAVDALGAIVRPMSPLLRQMQPVLHSPPGWGHIRSVLEGYASRDRVPRVQQRIEALLQYETALTKP
jgi:hypothetical protein